MSRNNLSSLNPLFYNISVSLRRIARRLKWIIGKPGFANTYAEEELPYRVKKHQSVLIRRLGDSDIRLQENKVVNLSIAIKKLNNIILKPGETFSFCYLVGKTTKKKGYLDGMVLCDGEARADIGGGLCQIANLINWLVLHSPLTITERHHHSFDPFPDEGRILPFGSGATVFYNYIDYRFTNNTEHTFQLLFWIDDKCLNGDLRVNKELETSYHVYEKGHRFVKRENEFYRQNEIWRKTFMKKGGAVLADELLIKNFSLVKYVPEGYENE